MKLTSDPRPVSQQVLSGLRISAVLVVVGFVVLLAFSYVPRRRIAAYYWHLRHGFTVDVGQYRIPAPKHWYVLDSDNAYVMLGDLDTGDGIMARVEPGSTHLTLPAWKELKSRELARTGRGKITDERVFQLNGETMACVEQDYDLKVTELHSIDCRSEGNLAVTFVPYYRTGKQHNPAFYAMLQHIQKF